MANVKEHINMSNTVPNSQYPTNKITLFFSLLVVPTLPTLIIPIHPHLIIIRQARPLHWLPRSTPSYKARPS